MEVEVWNWILTTPLGAAAVVSSLTLLMFAVINYWFVHAHVNRELDLFEGVQKLNFTFWSRGMLESLSENIEKIKQLESDYKSLKESFGFVQKIQLNRQNFVNGQLESLRSEIKEVHNLLGLDSNSIQFINGVDHTIADIAERMTNESLEHRKRVRNIKPKREKLSDKDSPTPSGPA